MISCAHPSSISNGGGGGSLASEFIRYRNRCQNTVAAAGASTNSGANVTPTPLCVNNSSTDNSKSLYATLQFSDSNTQYIQDYIPIAPGVTAVNMVVAWRSSATTGNVVWQVQTAYVGNGDSGDVTFNAAQTLTSAAAGTTLRWTYASLSTLDLTGYNNAASSSLMFKFFRDPAAGGDTLGAVAEMVSITFEVVY